MFFTMGELEKYWGISAENILHVGAHNAEELDSYRRVNCKKIIWIEAQSEKVRDLKAKLDLAQNLIIEAAIWDRDGVELTLKVTNNSESTSLLEFGSHQDSYPKITVVEECKVLTSTLDSVLPPDSEIDFVNLDIQGAELKALEGFKNHLPVVKWIYMEVNNKNLYLDCALVDDVDVFLNAFGFTRIATRWWKRDGWGDALYVQATFKLPTNLVARVMRLLLQFKWHCKSGLRQALNK